MTSILPKRPWTRDLTSSRRLERFVLRPNARYKEPLYPPCARILTRQPWHFDLPALPDKSSQRPFVCAVWHPGHVGRGAGCHCRQSTRILLPTTDSTIAINRLGTSIKSPTSFLSPARAARASRGASTVCCFKVVVLLLAELVPVELNSRDIWRLCLLFSLLLVGVMRDNGASEPKQMFNARHNIVAIMIGVSLCSSVVSVFSEIFYTTTVLVLLQKQGCVNSSTQKLITL